MSSHALTALLPAAGLVPAAGGASKERTGAASDLGFGALFDAVASALGRQGDGGGATQNAAVGTDGHCPASDGNRAGTPDVGAEGAAEDAAPVGSSTSPVGSSVSLDDARDSAEPGDPHDADDIDETEASWAPVLPFTPSVPVPVMAIDAEPLTMDQATAGEVSDESGLEPSPDTAGPVEPSVGKASGAPGRASRAPSAGDPPEPSARGPIGSLGADAPRTDVEEPTSSTRPQDGLPGVGRDSGSNPDRPGSIHTAAGDPASFAGGTDASSAETPSDSSPAGPMDHAESATKASGDATATNGPASVPSPGTPRGESGDSTPRADAQAGTSDAGSESAPMARPDGGRVPQPVDASKPADAVDEGHGPLGGNDTERIQRVVRDAGVRAARTAILDALQQADVSAGIGTPLPSAASRTAASVIDPSNLLLDGTSDARARLTPVSASQTGQSLEGDGGTSDGPPAFIDMAEFLEAAETVLSRTLAGGSIDAPVTSRVPVAVARAVGDGPMPGSGLASSMPGSLGAIAAQPTSLDLGASPGSLDTELPQQVVKAIRLQWNQGVSEARLRLRPEHLGEVRVSLRVEHGMVRAELQADTAEVRSWIRAHESELRRTLAEQGLDLDQLTVQDEPSGNGRERADDRPRQYRRAGRAPRGDGPRFEVRV